MKRLILFFIVILYNIAFSQSLINLYKNYIPKDAIKNSVDRNTIESNIEAYSQINPDLIYYYLNYLDAFFNKRIHNLDSNYMNILNDRKNYYSFNKSLWADKQIDEINNKVTDTNDLEKIFRKWEMKYEFQGFGTDEYNPPKKIKSLPIDSNMVEYFDYVYYSKNKESYNYSKNYKDYVAKAIKDTVKKLNELNQNFDHLNSSDQKKFINDIENYYSIVGDKNNNRYNIATNFDANVPVIKYYQYNAADYQTHSNLYVSFYQYQTKFNFSLTVPRILENTFNYEEKILPTFTEPKTFSIPIQIEHSHKQFFGLGYSWAVRKEKTPFSSIRFKFLYTKLNSNIIDTLQGKEFYTFPYTIVSGTEKYYYAYSSNGLNNLKELFLSFQISSPVYYLTSNLSVETGALIDYYKYSYSYSITKSDIHEKNGENIILSDKKIEQNYSENKLGVYPLLIFQYEFFKYFRIYYQGVFHKKGFIPTYGIDLKYDL